MSGPLAEAPEALLPAPPARPWVRLGLLLLLAGAWVLPWADVQRPQDGQSERELGVARTGAVALAALVVLWGLSATVLVARSRRGLRAGEAFTAAALAVVVAVLLAVAHPWIPGGEQRTGWLPVFGPLALLAALDAVTRLWARVGNEITGVRVGAGLFVAGSLVSDAQWLPAALAGWLALAPLAFLPRRGAGAARRGVEALVALAALAAGFAPTLQRQLLTVREPIDGLFLTAIVWSLLCALVVLTGASGVFEPSDAAEPRR